MPEPRRFKENSQVIVVQPIAQDRGGYLFTDEKGREVHTGLELAEVPKSLKNQFGDQRFLFDLRNFSADKREAFKASANLQFTPKGVRWEVLREVTPRPKAAPGNVAPIATQIIKPENCVIAFGIPTDQAGFQKDGDYAGRFRGNWRQYYDGVVFPLEQVRPELETLNVTILEKVTFEQFGALFHQGYDVIVFISHLKSGKSDQANTWKEVLRAGAGPGGIMPVFSSIQGVPSFLPQTAMLIEARPEDRIEFADGLVGISTVAESVPRDFAAALDLCLCHAGNAVVELVGRHPRGLVRHSNAGLTPKWWLNFYLALFKHLQDEDRTYTVAVQEVKAAFDKVFDDIPHLGMGQLKDVIESFNDRVGRRAVKLGGAPGVEDDDIENLLKEVNKLRKSNASAKKMWAGSLPTVYAGLLAVMVWSQGRLSMALCSLLLFVISLAACVKLRRLGREESVMDLLRAICLSPRFASSAQKADIITDLYPYL